MSEEPVVQEEDFYHLDDFDDFDINALWDSAISSSSSSSGAGLREIKALASGQLKFKIIVHGSPPVRCIGIVARLARV